MINYKAKHTILSIVLIFGLMILVAAPPPGPFILPFWAILILSIPLSILGLYVLTQHPYDGPDILTAAKRNDLKYMRWLVSQGVQEENLLSEALIIACQNASEDCGKLLLNYGADPNWKGYSKATYMLISELESHSSQGWDPTITANSTHELFLSILEAGADLALPIDSFNNNTSSIDLIQEYNLFTLIPDNYLHD